LPMLLRSKKDESFCVRAKGVSEQPAEDSSV
jgi:hypothetical protein